jgi:hypothetical protein
MQTAPNFTKIDNIGLKHKVILFLKKCCLKTLKESHLSKLRKVARSKVFRSIILNTELVMQGCLQVFLFEGL